MTKNRLQRVVVAIAAAALAFYVAAGLGLYLVQRRLLFPGQAIKVPEHPVLGAGVEAFRVMTSVGQTDAWLLPPLTATSGEKGPGLIFAHGNGEVIDQWLGGLDEFRRWGMSVMLVEYPGYGRSEGQPSEAAIREAMVGAYDLLANQPGVDREGIVGYGQSLGGGAICALARDRRLAAMVLQSTFTSIRTFASRYLLPGFLVRDPFDNDQVVPQFDGPILVLHGRQDNLIPYEQAVALAHLSPHSSLHLYECGHGCWSQKDVPLLADIRAFLQDNGVVVREKIDPARTISQTTAKSAGSKLVGPPG
jgi:pimeloyl-ACP methyl ester carboxylesterase